jgi:hypothetical protein
MIPENKPTQNIWWKYRQKRARSISNSTTSSAQTLRIRTRKTRSASVARSKAAMCGHFKTGHRTNVRDRVFYSFIGD